MGVCIYRRGRESTAVAIPSRLICMGQPLVPEEPAMTSSWTSSPSSSAFRSSRRAIQRVQLGPSPMTGPPPRGKVLSLDASGESPWVTSTATQQSGAIPYAAAMAPVLWVSSWVEPRTYRSTSSCLSRSRSRASSRMAKQARSSSAFPHSSLSPRGAQPAR